MTEHGGGARYGGFGETYYHENKLGLINKKG
jgi:hypothetical protein